MDDFKGLTCLVTGGASGIGSATVSELKSRGARVAVLDRSPVDVSGVCSVIVDLADPQLVRSAIDAVADMLGAIDVVINNAGVGAVGDVAANDDHEWHRVFDVNVVGVARVVRYALPWLRKSPAAAIVNTASVAGLVGLRDRALYSATKGALIALTYSMAADYLPDRVRVNAVAPGTADTPWVTRLVAGSDDPEMTAQRLRDRQPMGRLITAEEVAVGIAFLASPRAGAVTGTVLTIDGGVTNLR